MPQVMADSEIDEQSAVARYTIQPKAMRLDSTKPQVWANRRSRHQGNLP